METKPNIIMFHNYDALAQFSKTYEDTFDEARFTPDLVIKIGPDKEEFYCHRLMLVAASDFLRSVISTVATETTAVILLPDLDSTVMECVLMYIYYGEVLVPTKIYADFAEACKLLQLKGIEDRVQLVDTSGRFGEMETGGDQYDLEEFDIGVVDKIETGDYEVIEIPLNIASVETMTEIDNPSTGTNDKLKKRKQKFKPSVHKKLIHEGYDMRSKRQVSGLKSSLGQKIRSLNLKEHPPYLSKKIVLTPKTKETAKFLLMSCIKRAYQRLDITLTEKIESNIKDSKLIIENNKLMRGEHRCGLCHELCPFSYRMNSITNSINFRSEVFKIHLQKNHQANLNFVETEMQSESDQSDSKELITKITDQNALSESEPSKDASEAEDIIEETEQSSSSSCREIPNKKKTNANKTIKLNPTIKKRAKIALIRSAQRAYDKLGISLTPELKFNIKESALITENNKLIRGVHVCGLCHKKYSFNYQVHPLTGNIVFVNYYFKLHFQAKHENFINLKSY